MHGRLERHCDRQTKMTWTLRCRDPRGGPKDGMCREGETPCTTSLTERHTCAHAWEAFPTWDASDWSGTSRNTTLRTATETCWRTSWNTSPTTSGGSGWMQNEPRAWSKAYMAMNGGRPCLQWCHGGRRWRAALGEVPLFPRGYVTVAYNVYTPHTCSTLAACMHNTSMSCLAVHSTSTFIPAEPHPGYDGHGSALECTSYSALVSILTNAN